MNKFIALEAKGTVSDMKATIDYVTVINDQLYMKAQMYILYWYAGSRCKSSL